MKASNILSGIIAGFIGFVVNSIVQFLIEQKINWLTAIATALGIFLVFAIITRRYTARH